MTVDGIDRGTATAVSMSPHLLARDLGHRQDGGPERSDVTLSQAAWLEQSRSGRDYVPRPVSMLQTLRVTLPNKRPPR